MKKTINTCLLALAVACLSFGAMADESAYNKGVEAWRAKDYAEARKQWTQSLAEGGPDEAQNNLAFLLYHGLGGDPQPDKAVELWRKGAALSISEAQLHLGQAHEEGKGVQANRVQAHAWYLCAAATAAQLSKDDATERAIEVNANRSANRLAAELSAADLEQAKAMAQQLIVRYGKRLSVD